MFFYVIHISIYLFRKSGSFIFNHSRFPSEELHIIKKNSLFTQHLILPFEGIASFESFVL